MAEATTAKTLLSVTLASTVISPAMARRAARIETPNRGVRSMAAAAIGAGPARNKDLVQLLHQKIVQAQVGDTVGQRLSVEGGWYAVLRVPVTQSDEDLAIELLQTKSVLVHPGHFYDFAGDGYIVLSLIAVEGVFSEGVRRALDFLNY